MDKEQLFLTNINAGEVYYIAYRIDGSEKAGLVWKAIQEFRIRLIEADMALTYKAANLKAFSHAAVGNLFAKNEMPVAPFRTEDWDLGINSTK